MFPFQKNTAQSQKLCTHAGIRVLVLGIVLVTYAAVSFQGFTLAPPSIPSPFSPPASPEIGAAIRTGDPKNPRTPIQEERSWGRGELRETDEDSDYGDPKNPRIPIQVEQSWSRGEMGETDEDPDYGDPKNPRIPIREEQSRGHGVMGKTDEDPDYGDPDGEEGEEEDVGEFPVELGHGVAKNSSPSPSSSSSSHPATAHMNREARDEQSNGADAFPVRIASNSISTTDQEHAETAEEREGAVTAAEMYRTLLQNRRSSFSMLQVPRWASPVDAQILEARRQILDAPPMAGNDTDLYPPVFRNVSKFRRSYELMEKMLKVYVYKEGEPPVFHRPPLGGIYASEGWFMKQMESSRRFAAGDPGQAHLFYLPFSSSLLRFHIHVPGLHSRRNLVEHLRSYVATIAGKHPFWNRTGGADHFLAACHDWATDVTEKAMGSTIRALCNADLREGFDLGKDVSLPETNVRDGAGEDDPRRRPHSKKRPFLAFFAGRMHGYLRPLLLQHWENKHPDMKISGPLPSTGGGRRRRRKSKAAAVYAQYMRSSRYCICPRGYDVNSPRVVEAIVHGCVPVIVADGFVPPFFEVLDWEAFAVVLPEAEVPRLRAALAGIPRKKFLALQAGVREVRKHFLWNRRPARYDLFHMILHSVWLNRVLRFRAAG